MIRGTEYFRHREAAGIVADLFWDRRVLHDEFKDRPNSTCFVLYPATGREGIRACHHSFSAPTGTQAA
jgi:hypothetical protein